MFNEVHLEFLRTHEGQYGWGGKNPKDWAGKLDPMPLLVRLPVAPQSKDEVCNFVEREDTSAADALISICAWGGMTVRNGRLMWAYREPILKIISRMRSRELDMLTAYEEFSQLGKIPGMGPAYYTKLIHFLAAPHDGVAPYIMDQWTSRSVNLLKKGVEPRFFIQLESSQYVSRQNSAATYFQFCSCIESLAIELGVGGEIAEQKIFSRGGKKIQCWRKYVIENT